MSYDANNVFARILRGELPCKKVLEDAEILAFEDIQPQAPVHVLVIPKKSYATLNDFCEQASDAEIAALIRGAHRVAKAKGVEQSGYRILVNTGPEGGQEVPHVHVHVFGGRRLGRMVPKPPESVSKTD